MPAPTRLAAVARLRRWLTYALTALIVALVAVALIAPHFIDTPAARAEIQRRLDEALGGQISWQALEVRLLPVPHGELRQVRIAIPGKLAADAERVQVNLRIWPLLLGRAEIAAVTLDKPRIRIVAAGGADAQKEEKKELDTMTAYRAVAEPLVRALQQFAGDTTLKLSGAELSGPVALRNVNASALSGATGLDVKLEADSALWKRLRVEARLGYADLSTKVSARVDDVDLPAALALGGVAIGEIQGRVSASAVLQVGAIWQADIELSRSSATLQLAELPWKLSLEAAQIGMNEKQVSVKDLRGALGESTFTEVAAQVELTGTPRLSSGSGRATLRLEQWHPWLAQKVPLGPLTGLSGNLEVTLRRLALPFDKPQALDFEVLAVPRDASATLDFLPAPVALAGGAARVDARTVRLDKLPLAMLDAKTLVSGTIALREPKVELTVAGGVLGDALLRWALGKAGAPEQLELKSPLRFAARRIAWSSAAGLDLDAQFDVDAGPQVGVALGWTPQRLELRRIAIKDAQSDATLSAVIGKDLLQAGFSGLLYAQSVAALRRKPEPRTGRIQGELRLAIDRARPANSSAEGKLEIATLDLSVLAGKPALIERANFVVEGGALRIDRVRAVIDEQVVEVSGEIRATDQGPVVDARLESPGVVLARLLPPQKPAADSQPSKADQPSKLWPLPVTGRIAVRAGFVQLARQRIEPLEGSAVLERERVRLDVQQARMCGVSFPLQLDATPERYSVAARLAMKDEPFENAIKCLTGDTLQISGNADLRAELRTQGRAPEELLRNLTGTAEADLRKGRVERFALIGNILSVQNLTSIRDPREIDKGFAYRSMTARGRFEGGGFLLEEGFFDSDAARIAVNGKVDLVGADSQLNVLVGLLSSVDRVTGAIPILGDVLGGTLIALPVSVSGDIRDPRVVPLGRHAVSDRLLGVFERTLKLPGKLVPSGDEKESAREPKAP